MTHKAKGLAQVALIAAVYAVLTFLAAAAGLAFGQIQFRFSEALCVLAAFTPAAIPGLTLGCFVANLASPLGPVDWICGTGATLLAALAAYWLRKVPTGRIPWLIPLPSVVFNALIVGAEIAFLSGEAAFWPTFWLNALWVGAGEAVVCYALGLPLYVTLQKIPPLNRFLSHP